MKKTKEDVIAPVDIGALMAEAELPAMAAREGESAADLMAGLGDDPLAQERAEYEAQQRARAEEEKKKAAAANLFGGASEEVEDVTARRKGLKKRLAAAIDEQIASVEVKEDDPFQAEIREKMRR